MQATKAAAKELARGIAAHILVVDDEKSICELLEITFRKEGHRVEVAHNVEAAKRKLESQIFDIVISDVKMPGESGVELLKFTKEIAPDCFFCWSPEFRRWKRRLQRSMRVQTVTSSRITIWWTNCDARCATLRRA